MFLYDVVLSLSLELDPIDKEHGHVGQRAGAALTSSVAILEVSDILNEIKGMMR